MGYDPSDGEEERRDKEEMDELAKMQSESYVKE